TPSKMNEHIPPPGRPPLASQSRHIYTVSDLTANIKSLLEDHFPFVWISGEISNFRVPASGHFYFVLKDDKAQLSSVMFRGQNRNLKFRPADGMVITGLGRINVYEPRGAYQLLLEYLEPEGVGALQVAFEQLKARLAAEGLFDDQHKKPLPYLPKKIGIVTSPTGAVVHDILNVLNRRFPNRTIQIFPVRVQGDAADSEIASAIEWLNDHTAMDLIILARGGGSLEDLSAFNSETVARAIFSSEIPIVTAIGHETDHTIADFVADLRAPTPSAAAEQILPQKDDLLLRLDGISHNLTLAFRHYYEQLTGHLSDLTGRLIHPRERLKDLRTRTADATDRLFRRFSAIIEQKRERVEWRRDRLMSASPIHTAEILYDKLDSLSANLLTYINIHIDRNRSDLRELSGQLRQLSPMAILSRGYSITRTIPDLAIVKDPDKVKIAQRLEVLLNQGALTVSVLDRTAPAGDNVTDPLRDKS
ncbi:MAG: exodeoxyribonuclease VII large subunit, partial [Desulfobacterales bacterium]